jgi:hypothetical protein
LFGVFGGTHAVGATLSSAMPSQSLSIPSQSSVWGLFVQLPKPPPGAQPPIGTFCGGLQETVPAQLGGLMSPHATGAIPSSATPSQSLSQPSQISGEGVHVPQTLPSFVRPSQSLSTASQISVLGHWRGLPHLVEPSSMPAAQLLSTSSHSSPGLKQSQVAEFCCCAGVVQGRSARLPSGGFVLSEFA